MQRKTALLAVAAACALVGLVTWALLRGQAKTQYRTATVKHGDINVAISATGNPNAVVTVQVGSQVSGTILALYADFNTKVTKGQLIARIDPAALQAKVDQGKASLDAAGAAVANAEAGVQKAQAGIQAANASVATAVANVVKAQVAAQDAKVKAGRREQLAKEGVLSKEDVDTAQATYNTAAADQDAAVAQQRAAEDNVKVAQAELKVANTQLVANHAQVKQFEAALRSTQIDLDHTYIKAPVDGPIMGPLGRPHARCESQGDTAVLRGISRRRERHGPLVPSCETRYVGQFRGGEAVVQHGGFRCALRGVRHWRQQVPAHRGD